MRNGILILLFTASLFLFTIIPEAQAIRPQDFGLRDGDLISAVGSDDPDIYIINDAGYKRLFLNPDIFNFYGHLGGFYSVKNITAETRDAFETSVFFRNCESDNPEIYAIRVTGEDTGTLHWMDISGPKALLEDNNFFQKTFCINNNEFSWYSQDSNYTSLSQVQTYNRTDSPNYPTPSVPEERYLRFSAVHGIDTGSGKQSVTLVGYTNTKQDCLNYNLQHSYSVSSPNDATISVFLEQIEEPVTCFTGTGPARFDLPMELDVGEYSLLFHGFGIQDGYRLIVGENYISLIPASTVFTWTDTPGADAVLPVSTPTPSATPNPNMFTAEERDEQRIEDVQNLYGYLKAMFEANDEYPASLSDEELNFDYSVPTDPLTGVQYNYAYYLTDGTPRAFHVWTQLETGYNTWLEEDFDIDSSLWLGDTIDAESQSTETCTSLSSTARDCIFDYGT